MTNMKLLGLLAVCAFVAPLSVQAQTYDVDITMTGLQATPVTFEGSFMFNAAGTCSGSAAFCSSGTPEFSNVSISDPLSIDSSGGAFAFTDAMAGAGHLSFIDTYSGTPGQSSFVYTLGFSLDAPLGGGATSVGIDNIVFSKNQNVTGTYSCGGPSQLPTQGVSCPTAILRIAPTKAPEIDPTLALGEFTLLVGGIAVLCGRRKLTPSGTLAG